MSIFMVERFCPLVTRLSESFSNSDDILSYHLGNFRRFLRIFCVNTCLNYTHIFFVSFESEENFQRCGDVFFKGRDTRCDKSLRHVAATGCCNKSPRVACENHLNQTFVDAICRTNSNWCEFARHMAPTK